ncbi:MAG: hypothetical protein A3I75_00315 [Deltaproteobacteria bacterium RIFCSPLOWO2_02_FULL_50_16]|nr:MAG: hypothetical protein A2053_06240 [Deltaproteobacteria bacterium GWA2_50_8]OGQ30558.1 MAG: hypothetical protein A3B79_05510 [Deltaproteobacteria bacterium RIFCSPHIGHO2_02_FULL_50_15]OGQ58490.1 MAG: hypothetical protein A3I75_00315 [Deltaproteobacteria bacterium RIFCSPLOWO2_02_FULL_50_16]OGQ67984.1 MAG: hypothetical protein A3F89_03665 [Deltaproteobacteria bacterium RIFCSPLOWO2_12_FULL_50_11]
MKPDFEKVVIVGVGLIGASLGIDLLRQKMARCIVGIGRSRANLLVARRKKAITHIFSGRLLEEAWKGADLIILATPVAAMDYYFKSLRQAAKKGYLKKRLVITDVGSTKAGILRSAHRSLGSCHIPFVGAHPIAGTENSRAKAAFSGLYKKKICVVTHEARTPLWAVRKVQGMWRGVGAHVKIMKASQHDILLAHCSHLPHMVAYSLVHALLAQPKALGLAGGGFRDFTRIASSDPEMWRDICVENQEALLQAIRHFEQKLSSLKTMIRKREGRLLSRYFEKAREVRRRI